MNHSSSRLPVEVHTERRPSAELRRPVGGIPPADGSAGPKQQSVPWFRLPNGRLRPAVIAGICMILCGILCAVLIPALWNVYQNSDGWGQTLGQGILQGGLPPTGGPQAGHPGTADTDADTEATTDTMAETRPETNPETQPETTTPPRETDSPETEEVLPSESDTAAVEEPETPPADTEPSIVPPDEPTTAPADDTEPTPESDSAPDAESDSVPDTEPEPETAEPVPEGCYPITAVDVSQADLGAGYIICDADALPPTLPEGGLWATAGAPTVLIVHTHPYEGYSDGTAWYDPALGGLAQTDTPDAADGVVALGAELARTLRGMGVTVIQLRIAVSEADTASEIYARTESTVRSYCRLYPDIGLVLDLRRSAELTEDGGILRTVGSLGGETCAQVRISVNGGREEDSLGSDLAVALALREGLWSMDPAVSRPVRIKAGNGLVGDLSAVRVLTLEMGAAGNTYAEAKRLTAPIASVLSGMALDGR